MSLADELLADLEESGNDFDSDEIKVKEEPIDGDFEQNNGHDAIEKMEIDESVSESRFYFVFKLYFIEIIFLIFFLKFT